VNNEARKERNENMHSIGGGVGGEGEGGRRERERGRERERERERAAVDDEPGRAGPLVSERAAGRKRR